MNKKKDLSKKEIALSLIAILTLVIVVVGVSYAVWSGTFFGTKTNSITTGYISFNYTEGKDNIINIEDATPTADEVGKVMNGTTAEFDFTVSATFSGLSKIDYEIYATPITSTLSGDFVKVYLTDDSDNAIEGYKEIVPVYSSLEDSTEVGSKKLSSSSLTTENKTRKYKLRVWLASNYNSFEESKIFSFKVNIKAGA